MRVLHYDPLRHSAEVEHERGVQHAPKEEVPALSDFVTLHCALTAEIHRLIGAAELQAMKPTAILVNTARGPVVDEAGLAEALQAGTIATAGIDVFENEPSVHPELLQLEDVLVVPHKTSASVGTRTRMCMVAAQKMLADGLPASSTARSSGDPGRRQGLPAAAIHRDPGRVVRGGRVMASKVGRRGADLAASGIQVNIARPERIFVAGIGKAARPMCDALAQMSPAAGTSFAVAAPSSADDPASGIRTVAGAIPTGPRRAGSQPGTCRRAPGDPTAETCSFACFPEVGPPSARPARH